MRCREWESEDYDAAWYYGNLRVISNRCWACHAWRHPMGWFTPWLLERAHIVSKPRREDRRLVNILCTICHKTQHGERLARFLRPKLTLENMLWLKRENDPDWLDWEYMQKHSVRRLPAPKKPTQWYMLERARNK